MSQTIYILNGPNLNLLGEREPEIYGHDTLATIEQAATRRAGSLGHGVTFFQTNYEGAMVEKLHEARKAAAGVIINPAGWTFYSVAIMDALKMISVPKIELHISNVHAREKVYHASLVSPVVTAVIAGVGAYGYEISVDAMASLISRARR
jgi:3-dehydroquinate dehydratase-2